MAIYYILLISVDQIIKYYILLISVDQIIKYYILLISVDQIIKDQRKEMAKVHSEFSKFTKMIQSKI